MEKIVKIIVYIIFFTPFYSNAADLYLSDFSGQTGPAPEPAPYATTYLYLNNSPGDISSFKMRINYNPEVLSSHRTILNSDVLKDWGLAKVGHVSGGGYSYLYIEAWTVGAPIVKGSSVFLLEVQFLVKQNVNSSVWLSNIEGDIKNFTTQDADFSYQSSLNLYPPLANAGPDQVSVNPITLNGSGSSDTDNLIVSWNWSLIHRTNSTLNRTNEGQIITISDLASGFYDVTLTVSDDTGLTDTDTMLLAVYDGNLKPEQNSSGDSDNNDEDESDEGNILGCFISTIYR